MARRRRSISRLGALLGAGFLGLVTTGALYAFTDSGTLNVEVADSEGYAKDFTDEGAIVEYIGKDNEDFGASGSGAFDSFVRIEGQDPATAGYNTDGPLEFETKGGAFTFAILVSDIPVVSIEGQPYWELFADINESNSTGTKISLNEVEVYFTDDNELTGYPFLGDATNVYDFEGQILINDVNSGSGRGDLRYSIPLAGASPISIPADCGYKDPDCDTYFVLYSEWGAASGPYINDSGFEEWKVRTYPYVNVEKTATTTFTRTFPWTIEKSVTPDSWDLFTGESGTSEYTVALTKGAGVDSAWAVSGTITITNDSGDDTVVESVTDELSGVGSVTVNCGAGVSFPYDLDDGDTLVCSYSSALPNGTSRTNVAEVVLDWGGFFDDSAAVTFGAPSSTVNNTVSVTDSLEGSLGTFSATGSTSYTRTFDCDEDEGTTNNTATIVETGQSDSAAVVVNCHELTVTKDATTALTRTWEWDIDKSVTPETWDMFTGDSGTSEYTVDIEKVGSTDAEWTVSGNITVSNATPIDATVNSVEDVVSGPVNATVDCGAATFPYTLLAGATLECEYSATLPDGTSRINTATAERQNYDYDEEGAATASGTADISGTADVDFTGATVTEVNPSVDVTDTVEGDLGTFSDDDTVTYSRTFTCDGDEGTFDNTAEITQTGQESSAQVVVNCYELEVSKDADESFTRTYHWTIEKSSDDPNGGALTLNPGTIYADYPYEITVDLADPAYTDSDWAVEGDIEVENPAPVAATLNSVTDVLSGAGAVSVDCGVTFPYSLAAGATLTCTYEKDLAGAVDQTNTATATLQNYAYDKEGVGTANGTTDFTGTANVTFGGPTTLVDESITIVDDYGTADTSDDLSFGPVSAGDAPETFTYDRTFGPFTTDDCGEVTITNTATFTTNDTESTGSDDHTVVITIPCPTGCTLTQGYWKTHSEYGPAPEDENWFNIGDVDGDGISEGPDEMFFASGKTWYQVFWTTPKGGNAYYLLAHQYMAAKLNIASPADSPASVDAAITWAETFFAGRDPDAKLSKALRAEAIGYAGTLASYNEGDIGPGHCSEDSAARSAG
jgi:hypothetical protein